MKTIGIKIQKIVNINLVISGMNKLLSTKNVLYSSSPIIMFSTFSNDKSILPNGSCRQKYKSKVFRSILRIIYNYPPKGRWIVVDIYRDAKRRGIHPPLFTDPEGDSCFRIYQIRWIKNAVLIPSSETFAKRRAIFLSVRKTVNSQGYSELR